MPIYYIDYENGSDAGTGADWANAWKTVKLGATAARIAPGDEIREAKSPDPTSLGINATFTNGSDEVTLASALTKEIVNGGESWTDSADITSSSNTTRKVGTNGTQFVVASGFTTGLASYYALGGTEDFSGYEQISIQIYTSSAISNDNVVQITLCSDAAGATPVDTINILKIPAANSFHTYTIDTGGALGSSIQSVALYFASDPGTPTVTIGQIIACKASSADDSLTLSSLIGKNSAATSLEWHAIRGIIGTTVYLDYDNTSANSDTGQYGGTTVTSTGYKRECIAHVSPTSPTVPEDYEIQDTGHITNGYLTFSGGWNTSTTTQDGLTVVDLINKVGNGIGHSSSIREELIMENYGIIRGVTGFLFDNYYYSIIRNSLTVNCRWGVDINDLSGGFIVDNCFVHGCSSGMPMDCGGDPSSCYVSDCVIHGCSTGIAAPSESVITNTVISKVITGLVTGINRTAMLNNVFIDASSTEVSSPQGARVYSNNHDQTADNHWQFQFQGTVNSQTSTMTEGDGIEWKMIPNDYSTLAPTNNDLALMLKIGSVLAKAGRTTTIKTWVQKEHATDVEAKLIIPGGQIAGAASDIETAKADDTDEEQLSVSISPTETGVVDIYVYAWYVTAEKYVLVDTLEVT